MSWMNNLPFVTIPKSNKQSCRKFDVVHSALNKYLPVSQLQLIKQSIKSKSTDVISPNHQRATLKTEEFKTDVEANSSKHLQTKDKILATLKHPTKPIAKPARAAQRKSSPAKRVNLPVIELSNPLKKTLNNHPDTKNTTYNTKIAPLNHTTPIDLSSFILLDGDECQMNEITAKVIPAPRQSMYPGKEWYSYLDLVSRITRE